MQRKQSRQSSGKISSGLAAAFAICFYLILAGASFLSPPPAGAVETWEQLDRRLKPQIYELNVGVKIKLKNGLWSYASDMSPKLHYVVFCTVPDFPGARVVTFASAFPVKTLQADKTYFLTSKHVVNSGEEFFKECQRFYAAMRLYAEQTKGFTDTDSRFKELLQIANYSLKKNMSRDERMLYNSTIDGIWDAFDNNLSVAADPSRAQFQKYLGQVGLEREVGFYLHAPGLATQQSQEAKLYKIGESKTEDLALLVVPGSRIGGMELDIEEPSEGQEIQAIGYPQAADQIDEAIVGASKYYAPSFTTGRISRVAPNVIQVDAPIASGNSGGPLISQRGKVLGVVTAIARGKTGSELTNFGGAVTVQSIKAFAPELFGK